MDQTQLDTQLKRYDDTLAKLKGAQQRELVLKARHDALEANAKPLREESELAKAKLLERGINPETAVEQLDKLIADNEQQVNAYIAELDRYEKDIGDREALLQRLRSRGT